MDDDSDYVETGINLGLSFNYRLNAHLGLLASLSRFVLPVDEAGLSYEIFRSPSSGLDSDPWIINSYLAGLDIILPIYRSDFHFRILGGMASTRLPAMEGIMNSFRREESKDLAAAWSVGSGIRYQCFDKVTLSLCIDMFNTRPYLEDVWTYGSGSSGSQEYSPKVVVVHVSAALGFRIF